MTLAEAFSMLEAVRAIAATFGTECVVIAMTQDEVRFLRFEFWRHRSMVCLIDIGERVINSCPDSNTVRELVERQATTVLSARLGRASA